ncbi:uncharacterized protein LOC123693377 isoform X2 [Colias croceus]|uniref:uncharacterized protein LOC123693377 isoform X2 n=1 Tax=Colias crocea TaxID=72248 RepID=UPI001E27D68F|nr:uncharacterized protein LOC123693377 isoform X2 [Colias croceus]
MSGKPASVAASRAGGAGGPRVLVYVAEARQCQLDAAETPPQAHPLDALYLQENLPQHLAIKNFRAEEQRGFYKHYNEPDKFASEARPEYPQYLKDARGDDKVEQQIVKRNEWEREGYGCGLESGDLGYQRCGAEMQSLPGLNSDAVQSDSANCERDLGKYMNYHLLEQSVSHQSIVNQSINILNHQVRSLGSENEGSQLVRTAEGVVLAVVPSILPQHDTSEVRTTQSEFPQSVTVPLGWRRIVNGTSVIYISPSGTALSTLAQLREYLQTAGTCKCGLPCPLRPETAFSFDPKVLSKPYQAASGAELTKLCNHKRKLLATLQARAQSPATPPPQSEQKKGAVDPAKKKMKKRAGLAPNMSVSQMMVQRERPLNEFKSLEDQKRTASPGSIVQRPMNQACVPYPQQNMLNVVDETKQETHIQRSSHYLTVSSGWISQHPDNMEVNQKLNQPMPNPALNVGLPVLGTNGQIIGVNTSFNKQANVKNAMNVMPQNVVEPERKEEEKEVLAKQMKEESQIYCGLNQPLTPEVMQKINEQQQIFIQRNQKQIEVMKGYKTQMADNVNQNKQLVQNQYLPQNQLVIQNGTVVKTNSAKTPPWQVKRTETSTPNSLTSASPKLQKLDNMDYEMNNDEPPPTAQFANDQSSINQGMCSRVPPLPQHYNMMGQQWPNMDLNKKKGKGTKTPKKKNNQLENKQMVYGNNGMKFLQEQKKTCDDVMGNNVPSFMDDPSGYLAQQTALLNNTISRQVGPNATFEGHPYEPSTSSYNPQGQDKVPTCKSMKQYEPINVFRNNINSSPSPNTPDSSVVPDKVQEHMMPQCYKGCNVPFKNTDGTENQMRTKYHKNIYHDMDTSTSSPKHFDESPVTSSTFIERNVISNENCGPIQAGIVSTSNVSPTETLQPPEPSPTLSNSSRSTDTPHSGSSSSHQNCTFPMPSPAYSNPGSCRDNFNSNPPTPNSQAYPYNSPGPPNQISGTQMMHFISNHNVNKNLMEVDNISMVGVKPSLRQEMMKLESKKRYENTMPGYCPPPHLGGGPPYSLIQTNYIQTYITTMASFSVIRDTVTSVLAGKANTATTSINASQANFIRPPPPPSVNLATTYAIPNNQPDPFINSVNLPTSYPLHIAGTTAQNMISKSPLEMVQNVISSLPSKPETSNAQSTSLTQIGKRTTPGQILISSTGQIIVTSNHMPPPPPKNTTAMSQIGSNAVTNVTSSVTQVVPAVGGVQPMVNQPTVVVNTLQTPFVIQPPMMAVDGQVVQQNTVLPQIVAGGLVSGQSSTETSRQIEVKNGQSFVQGVAMLSPESIKKRSKKKKSQTANITNVLQIAAPQQNPNNIMVHSSPQHNTSPQFSPRGFQLSPTNNISPTPMLQALTIVPGKSGTPAHIVMNGQGNTSNFGSQQIITNTSPSQQINLLQPVNLINNASNVMSNFPAFQQFIVPNLGGMVMTADGTTIIQDNATGMPMQLQLQTVNGQNVLTPVQNPGVFTAGTNSGVVIRQNQQGKIIQSQHSPGAQFLSPNSQVMVNSPNFNGQLSPLLANLSPTNVTFNQNPQVRSGNVQAQEFIQTNQIGQTLMVPLSPKQVSIPSASNNRSNSTFVQQNTTIVQQQTTLVSNSNNTQITTNLQGGNSSRFNIDQNVLLNKQTNQKRNFIQMQENVEDKERNLVIEEKVENSESYAKFMNEFSPLLNQEGFGSHVRHSVSTQTLLNQPRGGKSPNQGVSGSSPPDTTTHSPLGASEAASPRIYGSRCVSTQGNYADTTTKSPEPADVNSSGMVQCVSSSEQDMAESQERAWPTPRNDVTSDTEASNGELAEREERGDREDRVDRGDRGERLERLDRGDRGELSKFRAGDLVWGPVRGYVSWPGKLVGRRGAAWAVRWFGERPPSCVPDHCLLTLTEGLEAHHAARTKHRKSRKLNTLLENAIQDAMAELDKKSDTERSAGSCEDEEDTPKKKKERVKKEKHFKKSAQKIEPRLRNAR